METVLRVVKPKTDDAVVPNMKLIGNVIQDCYFR